MHSCLYAAKDKEMSSNNRSNKSIHARVSQRPKCPKPSCDESRSIDFFFRTRRRYAYHFIKRERNARDARFKQTLTPTHRKSYRTQHTPTLKPKKLKPTSLGCKNYCLRQQLLEFRSSRQTPKCGLIIDSLDHIHHTSVEPPNYHCSLEITKPSPCFMS